MPSVRILRWPPKFVVIARYPGSSYLFYVYGMNRLGRPITPKRRLQGVETSQNYARDLALRLGDVPVIWDVLQLDPEIDLSPEVDELKRLIKEL